MVDLQSPQVRSDGQIFAAAASRI